MSRHPFDVANPSLKELDMYVYLFRHTEAVAHNAATDADRWLSPAGRKAARRAGKQLRRLDVRWDAILTSALVRSVQTAELAAGRLKGKAQVAVADCLRPGRGSWTAYRDAALASGAESVALVGHEPDLGSVLGQALGREPVSLAKGAVVGLSVDKAGKVTCLGLLAPGAKAWEPLPGPSAVVPARETAPRAKAGTVTKRAAVKAPPVARSPEKARARRPAAKPAK